MKIKYTKVEQVDIEVDVTFPIYRKYDGSDPGKMKWWHKVSDKLEELSVSIYDGNGVYIEVDTKAEFHGDEDYSFGLGKYACTKEEFDEAYEKAMKIVIST